MVSDRQAECQSLQSQGQPIGLCLRLPAGLINQKGNDANFECIDYCALQVVHSENNLRHYFEHRCKQEVQLSQRPRAAGWVSFGQ